MLLFFAGKYDGNTNDSQHLSTDMKCKPLSVINLCPGIFDYINRMIRAADEFFIGDNIGHDYIKWL